jgi:hypothetical protein
MRELLDVVDEREELPLAVDLDIAPDRRSP